MRWVRAIIVAVFIFTVFGRLSDVKNLCEREPNFDDMICSLRAISKQPKKIWKETKEVVALARKFNDEVVRPYTTKLDRKVQEDPEFLPHEFIEEANRWGLLF